MARYFATVARGLEAIAARELEDLGASEVRPGFAGVYCSGDRACMYRINLWARTLFRLLLVLHDIPCRNAEELYRGVQAVDWSAYLTPNQTLAVDVTGNNRALNHTHFTALQVKNAIVDDQRQRFGCRSSVDVHRADLRVNVHIYRDRATLSLDSSGTSLHRRGYRPAMGKAPLKETLAAALIDLSGWTSAQPFLDPLCGSGTLPLEACFRALDLAPGWFRDRYGFETWLDFDANLWQQVRQEAKARQKLELTAPIVGSDRDGNVIQLAHSNARQCGLDRYLTLKQTDLKDIDAPAASGVIICNPPYGERIGRSESLGDFYQLLGDVLKRRFKGWTAYVLSGNKELAQRIRLKSASRVPVYNGAIACQFLKYELF
jgi:putative N6-adenine-specific DNA methylase